jgi:hypothetical protein
LRMIASPPWGLTISAETILLSFHFMFTSYETQTQHEQHYNFSNHRQFPFMELWTHLPGIIAWRCG